jgi:hypothetical protein
LYGCETETDGVRGDSVEENIWAEEGQLTWKWRRPNNENLCVLYSSPHIIRVIESNRSMWAGHVALIGERKDAHRVLVGRPEGKRPLERPRYRQEYSMKMYLQEEGWGSMDRVDLAQDWDRWRALVNAVMVLRFPYNVEKFLTS